MGGKRCQSKVLSWNTVLGTDPLADETIKLHKLIYIASHLTCIFEINRYYSTGQLGDDLIAGNLFASRPTSIKAKTENSYSMETLGLLAMLS